MHCKLCGESINYGTICEVCSEIYYDVAKEKKIILPDDMGERFREMTEKVRKMEVDIAERTRVTPEQMRQPMTM